MAAPRHRLRRDRARMSATDLDANEAAFQARYPVLVTVGDWTVYDVRGAVP